MRDWSLFAIAPEGTHHLIDEIPAYERRFLEVMKFHAPGLAPVRDETGAYHILPSGERAYLERFDRTFGFYEERAAVVDELGWLHILADGTPLYGSRFAWCGNYQCGRATGRTFDKRYFHLGLDGAPAYSERYSYAGDYRDGIAVVQTDDGHTHIGVNGGFVHNKMFVDLDVFHKGYARARDKAGWHHVDKSGHSIYPGRFSAVEPFYNGQARVEDAEGALLVIDEEGRKLVELRRPRALPSVSAVLIAKRK